MVFSGESLICSILVFGSWEKAMKILNLPFYNLLGICRMMFTGTVYTIATKAEVRSKYFVLRTKYAHRQRASCGFKKGAAFTLSHRSS